MADGFGQGQRAGAATGATATAQGAGAIVQGGAMLSLVAVPLAFALLLLGAYLFLQNSQMQSDISSMNRSITSLEGEKASLSLEKSSLAQSLSGAQQEIASKDSEISSAKKQIESLSSAVSQKDITISTLRSDLQSERDKSGQLASEYQSMQSDINSSMAWFRNNAVFPENYSWSSSILRTRLETDCVENGGFSLACASYVLENVGFAIHYRTDVESSGKADHLQSLKETINSGWGDCEDYSFLFKSIINMVKRDMPALEIRSYQSGGSGEYPVYPLASKRAQDDRYYYVPNAKDAPLGTAGKVFPYVVCYNVNAASGHCVVALSEKEMLSSQDAQSLSGAKVFEPQNGGYLGTVGSQFGICGTGQCSRSPGVIYTIMADGDLYKHDGGKWAGYADYASRVSSVLG